jgi:hypothetical protein
MKLARVTLGLIVLLALVVLLSVLATPAPGVEATPPALASSSPERPTPRPTFPFPQGTSVPVTAADGTLLETEVGPLYVILSTVDDHGLAGEPTLDLASQPDPSGADPVGRVPSGTFAQVLEIRRLPPDFLRAFYRVRVSDDALQSLEGWVGDWHARRVVFVVEFDAQGCACPFAVTLWADAGLTQPTGSIPNRSPLRLIALAGSTVQVQALSDGRLGWLSRDSVHESEENEFLKSLAP